MAQKCEYAETNNFGRLVCTVDENRLCIFQRYCSKASEWQNSKVFSTCERRIGMAKNKNKSSKIENEQVENVRAIDYIEVKQENNNIDVEEKIGLVKEPEINIVKKKKRIGKVISVSKLSIVVKDENGKGHTLYNYPNAKYGDIIEF